MAKTSATKLATNARYDAKFKKLMVRFPIAEAEIIEKAAADAGQSITAYTAQAVRERIARETGKQP